MPEQKPRPAPVSTTALTDLSAASEAKVWVSSPNIASLIAFNRSGRLSRITKTPERGFSLTNVSVTSDPLDGADPRKWLCEDDNVILVFA